MYRNLNDNNDRGMSSYLHYYLCICNECKDHIVICKNNTLSKSLLILINITLLFLLSVFNTIYLCLSWLVYKVCSSDLCFPDLCFSEESSPILQTSVLSSDKVICDYFQTISINVLQLQTNLVITN